MKGRFLQSLLMLCLLILTGCATTRNTDGIRYRIKMSGARDGAVKKAIKESTVTWKLRKHPPSTEGQLRRRMEKDVEVIEDILASQGYYDGTVEMSLNETRDTVRVRMEVEQNERYRFRTVQLRFLGEPDSGLEKIRPHLRKRQRVVASAVFEEQKRILDLMTRKGYPFPKLTRRTVEVDRENRVVDLELVFDPGKRAVFGEVDVAGLESLDEKFIRRQLPWDTGDLYDSKVIDDFERKLLNSGVFGTVRVEPELPEDSTTSIPVKVRVSERDPRTIRLGVSYSDIGPGGKAYWEHRNFLGGGERLQTSVEWNPIKTGGSGTLTRSGFLDANQYLVLDLDASIESPDAYDAKKVTGSGMILRDFTAEIQGGIGLGYKYSLVEQFDRKDRYTYIFFPLQGIYDSRNDSLNPVKGVQLFARTAWFEDVIGREPFLKSQVEGRHYLMLWERYRLSSALRLTGGSIDGASLASVPADERFYAGGGGSIRGYEYQSVGPQLDGTPTGGDKLVEFSAELRLQPGRRLGYAAFVDGGTAYAGIADIDRTLLRFGAGVGLRWFTAIGPLRADFAYPLNPDDAQVERIQFYISLGQAF